MVWYRLTLGTFGEVAADRLHNGEVGGIVLETGIIAAERRKFPERGVVNSIIGAILFVSVGLIL